MYKSAVNKTSSFRFMHILGLSGGGGFWGMKEYTSEMEINIQCFQKVILITPKPSFSNDYHYKGTMARDFTGKSCSNVLFIHSLMFLLLLWLCVNPEVVTLYVASLEILADIFRLPLEAGVQTRVIVTLQFWPSLSRLQHRAQISKSPWSAQGRKTAAIPHPQKTVRASVTPPCNYRSCFFLIR